jgi:phosphatidylserine decarboxylase
MGHDPVVQPAMNRDLPSLSNAASSTAVPPAAQSDAAQLPSPLGPPATRETVKSVPGSTLSRLQPEPMDPQIRSIQPGGGVAIRLELAWGRLRRRYLKLLRPRYVARMLQTRRGDFNPCPHEVLDPRDLKFFRNQGGYFWEPQDDPFRWRDRLPFARVGLAELIVIGGGTLVAAIVLSRIAMWLPSGGARIVVALLAAALVVISGLIFWFFRNPRREIPTEAGTVVAPADGKIVTVEEVASDEFTGGPAIRIGIFLSIFDVHINRSPVRGRVIALRYQRGKMLNALRPESARENEQVAVRLEEESPPHRRMTVRQITGQFARRIVCWPKPGDVLEAGEQFGMIKLGSRTELVLPCETGLEIVVKKGDKVLAGSTIVARYRS